MTIFLIIIGFISLMETILPFIVRKTVVFGVSIPDEKINYPKVRYYKKIYSFITFFVSCAALITFYAWGIYSNAAENELATIGLMVQFGIILWCLSLYFYLHGKLLHLKRDQQWYSELKEVRVAQLSLRQSDEMLPWYLFLFPVIVAIGIIIFTLSQYSQFPASIPTHWGPNGQPDHFAEKTPFSVIALLLVLLTMQGMFLGMHELTKRSGIKLSAVNIKGSRIRQLLFRKYTSWLLLLMSIFITMLFSFLQVATLYQKLYDSVFIIILPMAFLILTLAGSLIFAVKVGKLNSKLEMEVNLENEKVVDVDEDRFWKGGIIYFNKNDPSIFVEKRFGIGWTLNFAHPMGYVVVFVPILLILFISFIA
ncbi:DUF1648 domain-containing protein [Niallia sp. 01092]|uniref:DUF1648 domain-containing protein n=1 Tax=unclassified Niallia TaxID=2837522 RepID=UPI003FCFCA9D